MGWAYYNDVDPTACAWLAELMAAGAIAEGCIDGRSITDVQPEDLIGFTQCHFFAGIGGWPYALRLAGVRDDEPVWTGSCPCQPFSVAGKQKGEADVRHLWPDFRRPITIGRPPKLFGEQVASKAGRDWLSGVRADLEALGYAVGSADLCAASVGAPHIRQRLYWMADATSVRLERLRTLAGGNGERFGGTGDTWQERRSLEESAGGGDNCIRVADAERNAGEQGWLAGQSGEGDGASSAGPCDESGRCGDAGGLGNANDTRPQGRCEHAGEHADQLSAWAASVFIPCLDGKLRRVPANAQGEPEPSLFPLAHGVSNRVGILRGSGNAICPQLAAEFIQASEEAIEIYRALT